MRVLVTGAGGFLGKNLVSSLKAQTDYDVISYHHSMGYEVLQEYVKTCNHVVHFAGVSRPPKPEEYQLGNVEFTRMLLSYLKQNPSVSSFIYSSSIQATDDNPYGRSKREAEKLIFDYGKHTDTPVLIYRLPNVFGKWCRPNYSSVVATFCYNQIHGLPLRIDKPVRELELVYIDDFVQEIIRALNNAPYRDGNFCKVPIVHRRSVSEIAEIIHQFGRYRCSLGTPNELDSFTKKLYSTYLSYLPVKELNYSLRSHSNQSGSFTEFMRTKGQGQFSVNVALPHAVKGNHWHFSKHEKFLVVSGEGIIRLRQIGQTDIIEYRVSGSQFEVVEIPPGYTHNIENIGNTNMVTIMWANENFDPESPDTWPMDV